MPDLFKALYEDGTANEMLVLLWEQGNTSAKIGTQTWRKQRRLVLRLVHAILFLSACLSGAIGLILQDHQYQSTTRLCWMIAIVFVSAIPFSGRVSKIELIKGNPDGAFLDARWSLSKMLHYASVSRLRQLSEEQLRKAAERCLISRAREIILLRQESARDASEHEQLSFTPAHKIFLSFSLAEPRWEHYFEKAQTLLIPKAEVQSA